MYSPRRWARTAASARVSASSLIRMCSMWVATVRPVTARSRAALGVVAAGDQQAEDLELAAGQSLQVAAW